MTRVTNFGRKRTYLESELGDSSMADSSEPVQVIPDVIAHKSKEAAQANEPSKKKRKKSKKTVEGESANTAKPPQKKSNFKEVRSETRRQKRINEREADTICFACREKGHAARHCPKTKTEGGKRVGLCYRCGTNKHTLARCNQPENPDNPFPFASCFVCNGKGHLASACPENKARGIYPNGGCCKLCGDTSHLARNCGLRKQDLTHNPSVFVVDQDAMVGADEDGFHVFKRTNSELERDEQKISKLLSKRTTLNAPAPKKKVVNF